MEKDAARSFLESVLRPEKDEAAIVTFTGEVTLEQGLTGNMARLRRAIDDVRFVPPAGLHRWGSGGRRNTAHFRHPTNIGGLDRDLGRHLGHVERIALSQRRTHAPSYDPADRW